MLRSPTRSWGLSWLPYGSFKIPWSVIWSQGVFELGTNQRAFLAAALKNIPSLPNKIGFMRGCFNFKKPQPRGTKTRCAKQVIETLPRKCRSLNLGFFSPLSEGCRIYRMGQAPHKMNPALPLSWSVTQCAWTLSDFLKKWVSTSKDLF